MDGLAASLTVYLLYAMGGFPFAVLGGKLAHGSVTVRAAAGQGASPGRGALIFLLALPLALMLLYAWRVSGPVSGETLADAAARLEWTQVFFLLMPPCAGLALGALVGIVLARRQLAKS